jgi:hypothetical protein
MKADLAAVAVATATTPVSSNVLQMARFFAPGVPADDATCVRMMRELRRREDHGGIMLRISKEFSVALVLLPGGLARHFAMDDGSDIECDAYGEEEEMLEATFEATTRRVGTIRGRATPEGCRQFIRDVRAAVRALKEKGLCPMCSDRATASMRLPRADFCAKCCWQVALCCDP